MPGADVKHISTAVWAPPGFLQCGMKWPCSCPNAPSALPRTSNRRSSAQCVQGTYCGGWRRCACLDAKTRVLAVGVLVSTTYNNLTADLLLTCRVPCHQPGAGLAGWAKNLGFSPLRSAVLAEYLAPGPPAMAHITRRHSIGIRSNWSADCDRQLPQLFSPENPLEVRWPIQAKLLKQNFIRASLNRPLISHKFLLAPEAKTSCASFRSGFRFLNLPHINNSPSLKTSLSYAK
jgi:hypothetical protein